MTPNPNINKLVVVGVFAAALIPRVAVPLIHGPAPLIAEMNGYWDAAGGLAAAKGFNAGHGFRAFLPPGYPAFLAVIRAAGGTPVAARVVQGIVGALTAVVTYLYARRLFGDKVAAAAAFAFALWPMGVAMGDFILSETTFTFLLLLGVWALGAGDRWRNVVGAAVVWGAAAYFREYTLYFFPALILCNVLTKNYKLTGKSVVGAFIVAACIAPWTVRNAVVLRGFVPVTTKSNVDFFLYNHNNIWQIINNESDQPSELQLFRDAPSELELSRLARERAFAWIIAHPALLLFRGLRTEANFVGLERDFVQHYQWRYYEPMPKPVLMAAACATVLPTVIALPLAFVGFLRFGRRDTALPAIVIVLVYVGIAFATYSYSRHRYPLTPLLITFAVATLTSPGDTWHCLWSRRVAAYATALFLAFLVVAWTSEIVLEWRQLAAL